MSQAREFEAAAKFYLVARSCVQKWTTDSITALAKGAILNGGDPIKITRRLDEFASDIGQIEENKRLRGLITQVWNELD